VLHRLLPLLLLAISASARPDVVATLAANPGDEFDLTVTGTADLVQLTVPAPQVFDFCTGAPTTPNIGSANNDGVTAPSITLTSPFTIHCDTDAATTFQGLSATVMGVTKPLVAGAPVTFTTIGPTCTGAAMLTWIAPTQNTDGTALTNLSGFKVYWGPQPGTYPNNMMLNNAAQTAHVVDHLCAGTTFFVMTALAQLGTESAFSNVAMKTIQAEGPTVPATPTDITVAPMAPATFTSVLSTKLGFLGDTMTFATPVVPTATRYEWELTHYENKIVDATTTTVPSRVFTATRNGHWTPRVRACNATGCSAWLSSIDKGYWLHFWIKPPTF